MGLFRVSEGHVFRVDADGAESGPMATRPTRLSSGRRPMTKRSASLPSTQANTSRVFDDCGSNARSVVGSATSVVAAGDSDDADDGPKTPKPKGRPGRGRGRGGEGRGHGGRGGGRGRGGDDKPGREGGNRRTRSGGNQAPVTLASLVLSGKENQSTGGEKALGVKRWLNTIAGLRG